MSTNSAALAAEVLAREGWPLERIEAVMHCIRAHRFRGAERPASLEAQVLFDADKLDVMGAFGAARTIGYAVQAGQPIFAVPSEQFLQTGETEPGEPHSAYHEYLFKLRQVARPALHGCGQAPGRAAARRIGGVLRAVGGGSARRGSVGGAPSEGPPRTPVHQAGSGAPAGLTRPPAGWYDGPRSAT